MQTLTVTAEEPAREAPEAEEWVTTYSLSWDATDDANLDDLFILDGEFFFNRVEGNGLAELPGSPLGDFGALYGPRMVAPFEVRTRVFAGARGRRLPEFAVGALGARGYRLTVRASARALVLSRGTEDLAQVPFRWQRDTWTTLSLRVEKADAGLTLRGEASQPGQAAVELTFVDKDPPRAGRPAVWGRPFASLPIQFDDLTVTRPASHAN
ncbi:MAG: hypothetical protein ACFBZ8_10730 [Opitutales bacterium]